MMGMDVLAIVKIGRIGMPIANQRIWMILVMSSGAKQRLFRNNQLLPAHSMVMRFNVEYQAAAILIEIPNWGSCPLKESTDFAEKIKLDE